MCLNRTFCIPLSECVRIMGARVAINQYTLLCCVQNIEKHVNFAVSITTVACLICLLGSSFFTVEPKLSETHDMCCVCDCARPICGRTELRSLYGAIRND